MTIKRQFTHQRQKRNMAPKTIKAAIKEALEDLSEIQLNKFRSALLDRKGETRVKTSAVEGKDFLTITDVLVSTFTEPGALRVTLKILRQIGSNEEAAALDSQTKAYVDKGKPRNPGGKQVQASQEVVRHVAGRRPRAGQARGARLGAKKPEEGALACPSCAYPDCKKEAGFDEESEEAKVRPLQEVQRLVDIKIQCTYISQLLVKKTADPGTKMEDYIRRHHEQKGAAPAPVMMETTNNASKKKSV